MEKVAQSNPVAAQKSPLPAADARRLPGRLSPAPGHPGGANKFSLVGPLEPSFESEKGDDFDK